MSSKNLNDKIVAEEQKLNALIEKRKGIDEKIQAIEADLEKYRLMVNNAKFVELQKASTDIGVSVDDVLAAIQEGNLTNLQNKITSQKNGGTE